MSRLALVLALVAGMLIPATGALAAADGGSFGIRLVDAPTDRRDDPRAHVAIVDHLRPGDVITRRVEVVSDHADTLTVRLAPGAAEIIDGQFLAADDEGHDLPGWIDIDPPAIVLDPGERQMATVTLSVPTDAAAGERYGVVWAAVASDPSTGPVTAVNRVGVRIYLSVGEGGEPGSGFEIPELIPGRDSAGHPVVRARVVNTGGRALDVGGELNLTDGPGGVSAGPFESDRSTTVAPGEEADVTFTLPDGLPDGPWTAAVRLDSGALEKRAEARLTFLDVPPEAAAAVPAEVQEPARAPAIAIAVGLLLLVTLLLIFILLGRRRRDDDEEEPVTVEEAPRHLAGV